MPVKHNQIIPAERITEANVVAKVQLLYDLLGGESLGRNGTGVMVAGLRLEPIDSLEERVSALESKS